MEPNSRAMTAGPMRLVDGRFTAGPPVPEICPMCRLDNVTILKDDEKMKVKQCDDCGGIGVITKGKSSWWYHDWQYPDAMAPRWAAEVFARA
jgi:hypothetical protein